MRHLGTCWKFLVGILLPAKLQVFLEACAAFPHSPDSKEIWVLSNLVALLDHSFANCLDCSMEMEPPHSGPEDLRGRPWLRRWALCFVSIYHLLSACQVQTHCWAFYVHFLISFSPKVFQIGVSFYTCFSWGNWGTEKLDDLPKIAQPVFSLCVPSDSQAWAFSSFHSREMNLLFGIC